MAETIVLYSSITCSRCKLVKRMLDNHNVEYQEINDKQVAIDKGFVQIPVLEIGNKIIEDFTSVLAWLEDNGYYSERGIYESN